MQPRRGKKGNTAKQLQALSIALSHPTLGSDTQVLCAAARTCRSWQQAVQQSSACNLSIAVERNTLKSLASLASWLVKHAGLVRSLTAFEDFTEYANYNEVPVPEYRAAAQLLLQQALQLSAARAVAAAASSAAVAAAANIQALDSTEAITAAGSGGLRLVEFSSSLLTSPSVLQLLPGHSLTRLELKFDSSAAAMGPGIAAALDQLSKLRQLELRGSFSEQHGAVPSSCLAGLSRLKQLTSLTLRGFWDQGLAQQLAQPLPLRQLLLNLRSSGELDLSHLSRLEVLESMDCLEDSPLPAQLQRLTMVASTAEALAPVSRLQALQQLSLTVDFDDPPVLQPLVQLPALQALELAYESLPALLSNAQAWSALPQLHKLQLMWGCDDAPTPAEMERVLSAATACSALTSLALLYWFDAPDVDEQGNEVQQSIAVCSRLAGLTGLRELHLQVCHEFVPGDVIALSRLTGLTLLKLEFHEHAVLDDMDVALLASSLKQLRHLDLSYNFNANGMVCLASIAQLTQLTALKLLGLRAKDESPVVTAKGLMACTRLTQLQQLEISRTGEVTEELLSQFWRAVKSGR